MELVTTENAPLLGKSFSCAEASISLSQCATSLKALASLCLFGKVIAPMNVVAEDIIEYVTKNWLKPVAVCSVSDPPAMSNCFKLSFECVEDKQWALENGPWSFRGYTFILYAWFPGVERSCSVNMLKVWVQVHNLPHEFYSLDNGIRLGSMIGKVLKVELDEEKPMTWGSFFRILVDLNFLNPLMSGCYFDLSSGEKKWLQFKFEKIGIFCYNCGRLGHQRRGCSLASPVTVESVAGSPCPLFGPWMSTASRFQDVFSCVTNPESRPSVEVKTGSALRDGRLAVAGHGGQIGGSRSIAAGGRNRWKKVTGRAFPGHTQGVMQKWVQKGGSGEHAAEFAVNGNMVDANLNSGERRTDSLPCLESSNVLIKPNEPLVKDGLCTEDEFWEDGPNKDKSGMGLEVFGPGSDFSLSKRPELICNVGNDSENVLNGGPGRGKEGEINWAAGSIVLARPNEVKAHIGKESEVNGGPRGFGGDLVDVGKKNYTHETFASGAVHQDDEERALSLFLKAQEELLYDLKHFGKMDLYEIKKIGGDIGVKPSSETNERTTPFKKRKFEGSASLCTRPNKIVRRHPDVVRDFPWDHNERDLGSKVDLDDLSEEPSEGSSSPSCNNANKRGTQLNRLITV
ncbi:hypothetical protein F8388_018544 [Cannabis sativa]|uniref:CCHC-type domain-containing protein n=1 Tax=Cannabis sativa TaxID=3483 RepID=A0A7J6G4M8_CANSA|nr:hypothetical protein F8388_018544 [Cannabis sativa]